MSYKKIAEILHRHHITIARIASQELGIILNKELRSKRMKDRIFVIWNKGLTSESSSKVKNATLKGGQTLKKLYAEKKLIPWNKDKKTGLIPWNKGKKGLQVGWNKGLNKYTNKSVEKISESKKGKKNPMYGKPAWNKNFHKKLNTGRTHFKKGSMQLEKAIINSRNAKGIKPNKPERLMIDLIKKNNLSFNYVGDGKIWFRGQGTIFNPDFLSKNPKYIIEVFGDYWHDLPKSKKRDKKRLKTYSKYGYKTLVIWQHELKNSNQVLNKVKEFIR